MEELKKHPLHQHRKPSRLEAEALDETRKRAKDRRAKRLVSNTSAGVAMRKEMVSLVKKELEAALKPYDEQGQRQQASLVQATKGSQN